LEDPDEPGLLSYAPDMTVDKGDNDVCGEFLTFSVDESRQRHLGEKSQRCRFWWAATKLYQCMASMPPASETVHTRAREPAQCHLVVHPLGVEQIREGDLSGGSTCLRERPTVRLNSLLRLRGKKEVGRPE